VDIRTLPLGTRCLVDSNVLLYHISGSSLECKSFLRRIALGELEGYVTTVIIAEVLHRQMLIEAVTRGFRPARP
jgi:predicted nucleic acid-binding protein